MTEVNEKQELKPCPCCGSALLNKYMNGSLNWVECTILGCRTRSGTFASIEQAIEAWNNRRMPIAEEVRLQTTETARQIAVRLHRSVASAKCDEHEKCSLTDEIEYELKRYAASQKGT